MTEPDPRPTFLSAIDATIGLARTVRPAEYDRPTPCHTLDVRGLLGHLVGVLDRSIAVAEDRDSIAVEVEGFLAPGDDWGAALGDRAALSRAAWADDAQLAKTVVLPWATQDGAACLRMWTNEMVVHGWDLAAALGRDVEFSSASIEAASGYIHVALPVEDRAPIWEAMAAQFGLPSGALPPVFANAVPCEAGATDLQRLVAWNGRNPAWKA